MAPAKCSSAAVVLIRSTIAVLALSFGLAASPAKAQSADPTLFDSPEKALAAFQQAVQKEDHDELHRIFGAAIDELKSGDKVQDRNDFEALSQAMQARAVLDRSNDGDVTVLIGVDGYPFPIPLRQKDGKWFFDMQAGKEEIINRRVGENELRTIAVCRTYVLAQREYFLNDYDGDGVLEFAQKLSSATGQRDGLYWPTEPGDRPSPFGPLVAQARAEGYGRRSGQKAGSDDTASGENKDAAGASASPSPRPDHPGRTASRRPYFGYLYKTLTGQKEPTPGGTYEYVINGNMVAGFGLVAFPVSYGESGVMTFVVNANNVVWQKDLGEKTEEIVAGMDKVQIDDTWTVVTEDSPWVAAVPRAPQVPGTPEE